MGEFFRAPPMSLAEWTSTVMETLDGIAETKQWAVDALSEKAFKAAVYSMGFEIEGEVTLDSIGLAMGDKIKQETGLNLGNLLDGENVKIKVERAGLARVIEELGVAASPTREGLAEAIQVVIRRRISQKIGAGGADALVGVMGNAADVNMVLAAVQRRDRPLLDTAAAISNRARQKTFRETHKRVVA